MSQLLRWSRSRSTSTDPEGRARTPLRAWVVGSPRLSQAVRSTMYGALSTIVVLMGQELGGASRSYPISQIPPVKLCKSLDFDPGSCEPERHRARCVPGRCQLLAIGCQASWPELSSFHPSFQSGQHSTALIPGWQDEVARRRPAHGPFLFEFPPSPLSSVAWVLV